MTHTRPRRSKSGEKPGIVQGILWGHRDAVASLLGSPALSLGGRGHGNAGGQLRRRVVRLPSFSRGCTGMSASVQEQVLGRKWFYPFRLPDGRETDCYLPPETIPIHSTREAMLWQVLDPMFK